MKVVFGKVDMKSKALGWIILLEGKSPQYQFQKNWMPFVRNGHMFLLASVESQELYKVNTDLFTVEPVNAKRSQRLGPNLEELRGNTVVFNRVGVSPMWVILHQRHDHGIASNTLPKCTYLS